MKYIILVGPSPVSPTQETFEIDIRNAPWAKYIFETLLKGGANVKLFIETIDRQDTKGKI